MVCKETTPYGPLACSISCVGQGNVTIPAANPFAYLWKAVKCGGNFATFFEQRLRARPATPEAPWGLVIYTDGVTPGDPLAAVNNRKFQACYWSFIEMGPAALSRQESWFIAVTEFDSVVKGVSAGLSQVFGAIVKLFFDPGVTTCPKEEFHCLL